MAQSPGMSGVASDGFIEALLTATNVVIAVERPLGQQSVERRPGLVGPCDMPEGDGPVRLDQHGDVPRSFAAPYRTANR